MAKAPTDSEFTNFFWHCVVAAKLADELPEKTATKCHVNRAVRMATLCWAGKRGVQHASKEAITQRGASKAPWERCGLIKEHVVPVSIIQRHGLDLLGGKVSLAPTALAQFETLPVPIIEAFDSHPRARLVAQAVMQSTILAWITPNEEKRFDEKDRHDGISLRKCMPKGWKWGDDPFARYPPCEITLVPI